MRFPLTFALSITALISTASAQSYSVSCETPEPDTSLVSVATLTNGHTENNQQTILLMSMFMVTEYYDTCNGQTEVPSTSQVSSYHTTITYF